MLRRKSSVASCDRLNSLQAHDEVKQWLIKKMPSTRPIPTDLIGFLRDGICLCELVIILGAVGVSILPVELGMLHIPEAHANVKAFLTACTQLKVPLEDQCSVNDVVYECDGTAIISTLLALKKATTRRKMSIRRVMSGSLSSNDGSIVDVVTDIGKDNTSEATERQDTIFPARLSRDDARILLQAVAADLPTSSADGLFLLYCMRTDDALIDWDDTVHLSVASVLLTCRELELSFTVCCNDDLGVRHVRIHRHGQLFTIGGPSFPVLTSLISHYSAWPLSNNYVLRSNMSALVERLHPSYSSHDSGRLRVAMAVSAGVQRLIGRFIKTNDPLFPKKASAQERIRIVGALADTEVAFLREHMDACAVPYQLLVAAAIAVATPSSSSSAMASVAVIAARAAMESLRRLCDAEVTLARAVLRERDNLACWHLNEVLNICDSADRNLRKSEDVASLLVQPRYMCPQLCLMLKQLWEKNEYVILRGDGCASHRVLVDIISAGLPHISRGVVADCTANIIHTMHGRESFSRTQNIRCDLMDVQRCFHTLFNAGIILDIVRHYLPQIGSQNHHVLNAEELKSFWMSCQGASTNEADAIVNLIVDEASRISLLGPMGTTDHGRVTLVGIAMLFRSSMYNPLVRPNHGSVHQTMDLPLSQYFVSTSFNSFLSGGRFDSLPSVNTITRVLASGCRCLTIEVYEHEGLVVVGLVGGSGWISAEETMNAVASHAFKQCQWPLILHVRSFLTLEGQKRFAAMCSSTLGAMLVTASDPLVSEHNDVLPSPATLKYRILIQAEACSAKVFGDDMLHLLSFSLPTPLIGTPDNNSSALETVVVLERQVSDATVLSRLNLMTRDHLVYLEPGAARFEASNPNPIPLWGSGIQMVALHATTPDIPVLLNDTLFHINGHCGYHLRPGDHTRDMRTVVTVNLISGDFLPFSQQTCFDERALRIEIESIGYAPSDCKCVSSMTVSATSPIAAEWNENFTFAFTMAQFAFLIFTVVDVAAKPLGRCALPISYLHRGYKRLELHSTHEAISSASDRRDSECAALFVCFHIANQP